MDVQTLDNIPPWEWSEDANQIIFKCLGDKNAPLSDRMVAAGLAGDAVVMNDKMADLLLAVMQDSGEPEELRSLAAIALGPGLEYGDTMGFDDPDDIVLSEKKFHEVQARLWDLYQAADTPKNLRRRVLEGAVRSPGKWHSQAIRTAYTGNDPDWVLTAVFCMNYIKGFDKQILESLESEDPEIFYHAVCAAGNWEIKAAWPYVEELINREDIDKPLLLAAIEAAVHIDPYEAVDLLSELSNSPDEEIAATVEEALAMAGLMVQGDLEDDDLDDDDF